MDAGSFALVLTCVFLWAVVSARAERAYLSAPIVFVAVGWLLAAGLDVLHPGHEPVKVVAETTLVWVLFADASTREDQHAPPGRGAVRAAARGRTAPDGGTRDARGHRAARHGAVDGLARRRGAGTDRRRPGCGRDDRSPRPGPAAAAAQRRERAQRRHRHADRAGGDRRGRGRQRHRRHRRARSRGGVAARRRASSAWGSVSSADCSPAVRAAGAGCRRTSPGPACWRWPS